MALGRSPIAATFKRTAAAMFPSLWVQWRLMHRARTAEAELALLKKLVRPHDVTVDVGANLGLYTRELSRLSAKVHSFEPTKGMADVLRRTSARNVTVHEVALSDADGFADLHIPRAGQNLTHSLASLEPTAVAGLEVVASRVPLARLDAVVRETVSFVKVDVEGHEINVLKGARGLIERCRPVFLVESENRHRENATASLFDFFRKQDYAGYFLRAGSVVDIADFEPSRDQDTEVLRADGGRSAGRHYINNFFFFPAERDGRRMLTAN